ncbi:MAG: S41 family peptidase [Candidatus Limimorpha sp.]
MKYLICIMVLVFTNSSFAQDDFWQWPIHGGDKDKDILYLPNSYIGTECVGDNLIITGDKDCEIVSPVSGIVEWIGYVYNVTMGYSISFHLPITINRDDDVMQILQNNPDNKFDPDYVSISLCIRLSDQSDLYLTGLRNLVSMKTGQKVEKGELIGTIGFLYERIHEPAIAIGLSKKGAPLDPMAPFGLKGIYKGNSKSHILPDFLANEEAVEDIMVFDKALREFYPGMFDYIDEIAWDSLVEEAKNKVGKGVSLRAFLYEILEDLVISQKDNHLSIGTILPSKRDHENYIPPALIVGFMDGRLQVIRTKSGHEDLLGKEVAKINGITQDSLCTIVLGKVHSDGNVQSAGQFHLTCMAWNYDSIENFTIEFTDATKEQFTTRRPQGQRKTCDGKGFYYAQSWSYFHSVNRGALSHKYLNDNTAYIGLYSFFLNDVELEDVRSFLEELTNRGIENLIVDLRNNDGGSLETCGLLLSYFMNSPFLLSEYDYVKKIRDFHYFAYCSNLDPVYSDLSSGYRFEPWKDGYRSINTDTVYPNPIDRFPGKLYVLANESSVSAATLFANMVQKHKLGVVVGRETGSVCAQMNATKFANLILPNSRIEITIPLIKTVFDSSSSANCYGRGVIPDYPIGISLEELTATENNDTVISYTLTLIRNHQYLKESENDETNEMMVAEPRSFFAFRNAAIVFVALVMCGLIFYLRKREKWRV